MERDVWKTKAMRIPKASSPIRIAVDQKQIEKGEYFNYLGSMITNDARWTSEIKSRISVAKAAFNNNNNDDDDDSLHQQTGHLSALYTPS